MVATFVVAWFALNEIPFLANLLAVRLTIYVYMFAGLLLAVFVDAVLERARRQRAVGALALLVALVPLAPALPFTTLAAEVPAYFSGAAVERLPAGSVAMVFPFADSSHSKAMLWQATAEIRFAMPSGYVFVPVSAANFLDPPPSAAYELNLAIQGGADPASIDTAGVVQDIKRWNVQTVMVGPMANEDAMVAVLTRAIGSAPVRTGDMYVWEGIGDRGSSS